MKRLIWLVPLLWVFAILAAPLRAEVEKDFSFTSYHELTELFETLNYTPKAWQAGIRGIPRVYLSHIPARWGRTVSKGIEVAEKKRIFFRTLAPLVLRSNELITRDRERLLALAEQADRSAAETAWLGELAVRYRLADEGEDIDTAVIDELKRRVDIVPVSLALAQAAEESGWGTSRFADLGNAVFGQWTWGRKGITPKEQRAGKGNYKIAAFDSPIDSVRSYMRNINTNAAYADLRARRATLRAAGEPVSGRKLAETLTRYSERGQAYVQGLHSLMRINRLEPADTAFLAPGPTYILRPVGEDAK